MCYIKKTNEIKSFINFDEFECDYERAYIEAVFVKSQNLTQGLIVNGKFLQNYQNLTSNDLYLIYEYSNSKINYSYLYENLKFITNHHKISKIIEISSYILLKHLSHIPHLFSYSSYPLVTHKRISRLITATNETSFNIDVVLNPFKKSGKRLIALGKWLLNLDSTINITMTASNIENTNVNTSPKFNHNNLYKFLIKNKFESDLTFENRNGKY